MRATARVPGWVVAGDGTQLGAPVILTAVGPQVVVQLAVVACCNVRCEVAIEKSTTRKLNSFSKSVIKMHEYSDDSDDPQSASSTAQQRRRAVK